MYHCLTMAAYFRFDKIFQNKQKIKICKNITNTMFLIIAEKYIIFQ